MTRLEDERQLLAEVRARMGADAARRLRRLRLRLWLRRAIRGAVVAAAAALGAVALVQLVARSVALEAAPLIDLAIAAIALVAWLAWCGVRRPTLVDTARRADDELGLRERLATSLELAVADPPDGPAGELVELQLRDARAQLATVDEPHAFRPTVARRPALAAVGAVAFVALLAVWPNPQDGVIADRRAARNAAQEVANRVEQIANRAERPGEANDPRRQALIDELRNLVRQLRAQGNDRQATLARIGSVQEQLARMTRSAGVAARRGPHSPGAAGFAGGHGTRGRQPAGRGRAGGA